MRAVVQPRVQRHERLAAHALQPPHELGEQPQRGREQVAAQRPALRRAGAIRPRRERGSRPGSRRRCRRARAPGRPPAGRARQSRPGGSAGSQASCECECGSDAPASRPSFRSGKQMPPTSRARRCHASATRSSVGSASSPIEWTCSGRATRPPAARAPGRGSGRRGRSSRSARRRAAASPAASGPRARRRTGTPRRVAGAADAPGRLARAGATATQRRSSSRASRLPCRNSTGAGADVRIRYAEDRRS